MRNCHVLSSPQTNIIYVSIDRSIHPPVNQWINQIKSKKSNQTIKSIQTKSVQFKSNKNQTIKLSNISIIMHHHHHHRYASTITHHVSSSVTINRPSPPNQPRAFCVNSAGLCSCSMYSKAYLLRSVIHPCIHVGWWSFTTQGPPKTRKPRNVIYLAFFYVASYIHVNIEPWCFDPKGIWEFEAAEWGLHVAIYEINMDFYGMKGVSDRIGSHPFPLSLSLSTILDSFCLLFLHSKTDLYAK